VVSLRRNGGQHTPEYTCIIVFNPDYKNIGITIIEVFIARGLRNDVDGLWNLFTDGELCHEIETLRKKAVTKKVTMKIDEQSK
jgi:hypothetical protein